MNIAICYVYRQDWANSAVRFVSSYNQCQPGLDHSSLVVCNGGPPGAFEQVLFGSLPNLKFLEHDNSGYDIGAFQMAARTFPCDVMVFFGATAWIPRSGWLARVAQSVERHGFALYGTHGNQGDERVNVSPHVRTTGWWIAPSLLNKYPYVVKEAKNRYEFEHGKTCLANWIMQQGLHVWVVTQFGEYMRHQWDQIPDGFHRGNQSALLFMDRLTDPPYYG